MTYRAVFAAGGLATLLMLAGCGRSLWQYGERASWRHEAEVTCLKSGAVKLGANAVQIQPIEGPGVCGADFPLKVMALGESSPAVAYADDLRPPAAIPNASLPRWPVNDRRYAPPPTVPAPPAPIERLPDGTRMQWITGPRGIQTERAPEESAAPDEAEEESEAPGAPMSIAPPDAAPRRSDDIPADAILPPETRRGPSPQPVARAPYEESAPRALPPLGPMRGPASPATPVALTPPATLACPIVSALDRWVSEGVQPAALHWFGTPVTAIKQISAYSCRDMVGTRSEHISEHAFGNAIDIAGFTFADGRSISVRDGWHGSPEEQGFLHDVQLYACETFTTVLAPGYNAAHYNHIHVDLMRRASGRRPCRPNAVPGEVVAAKVRAHYADKRAPAYTGSLGKMVHDADAEAGEDDLYDDEPAAPSEPAPKAKTGGLFDFSQWRLFQKSSLSGQNASGAERAQAYSQ
jgi:hypothetical protein